MLEGENSSPRVPGLAWSFGLANQRISWQKCTPKRPNCSSLQTSASLVDCNWNKWISIITLDTQLKFAGFSTATFATWLWLHIGCFHDSVDWTSRLTFWNWNSSRYWKANFQQRKISPGFKILLPTLHLLHIFLRQYLHRRYLCYLILLIDDRLTYNWLTAPLC